MASTERRCAWWSVRHASNCDDVTVRCYAAGLFPLLKRVHECKLHTPEVKRTRLSPAGCPSGYSTVGTRCYAILSPNVSRDGALSACAANGTELASLETQNEHDDVEMWLDAGQSGRVRFSLRRVFWRVGDHTNHHQGSRQLSS